MKIFLMVLISLLIGYQSDGDSYKQRVQDITNQVINNVEVVNFLSHYGGKDNRTYFRFGPSPVLNKKQMQELKNIVLKIKDSDPLVYDESQDENKKPVVIILLLKLDKDTAIVRIGLPIEGMVGEFNLVKNGTWTTTKSSAYEI